MRESGKLSAEKDLKMKKVILTIAALAFLFGSAGFCYAQAAKTKASAKKTKTTAAKANNPLKELRPAATEDEIKMYNEIKNDPKKVADFMKVRKYMRVIGYPDGVDEEKVTMANVVELPEGSAVYAIDMAEQLAWIKIGVLADRKKRGGR
jgi:hypothetical protein